MGRSTKLLPVELAAIVHHVELNRTGWWDKTIHRLVLASVWLADKPPTIVEIQAILKSEFRLTLNEQKLYTVTQALESQSSLVRLEDSSFRIPEDRRIEFEKEIEEAERATANAQQFFSLLIEELCPEINSNDAWLAFDSKLLTPLIKEAGANAYRLIAGERLTANKDLVRQFIECFDVKFHQALSDLIGRFLDPKKDPVRLYVSRMLHATFCVEASGLPEDVIEKMNINHGKHVEFQVFVDTNFLFSMLALHDNPSNEAASELQEMIATFRGNPKVDLCITPNTIDEAKHSIALAKSQLVGVPAGMNFTEAALRVGVSGMAKKFLEERARRKGQLTPDDWFDPYLNNFVSIARSKGVELYNQNLDNYTMRQDVVDDINLIMKAEARRLGRHKTYEMIRHDMVLWHFVHDRRLAYIESPIDAKDWILTVDFRLIGFDEHKQKQSGSKVPTCLHPSSFLQLLQFWVPRTKEFEEAILGSLRLPFLFQKFDAEAERTSLRILKGIGRFEGSEDLSEEAITDILLNDGLRARMKFERDEDAEIALIRDALLEELKARAEAEKTRAQGLLHAIEEKDAKLSSLDADKKSREKEIEQLAGRIAASETNERRAEERIQSQGQEIDDLRSKIGVIEDTGRRRRSLISYLALLLVIVTSACGIAWWISSKISLLSLYFGVALTRIFVGSIAFVFFHLCLEWWGDSSDPMKRLWPFQKISRFRAWLWSMVIVGLIIGVIGNIAANKIPQSH